MELRKSLGGTLDVLRLSIIECFGEELSDWKLYNHPSGDGRAIAELGHGAFHIVMGARKWTVRNGVKSASGSNLKQAWYRLLRQYSEPQQEEVKDTFWPSRLLPKVGSDDFEDYWKREHRTRTFEEKQLAYEVWKYAHSEFLAELKEVARNSEAQLDDEA